MKKSHPRRSVIVLQMGEEHKEWGRPTGSLPASLAGMLYVLAGVANLLGAGIKSG